MIGDDGSYKHVHVDHAHDRPPEPGAVIDGVWVLVVVHRNGGEAIYGQVIGSIMVNFVTESEARKEMLDGLLRAQQTYEVAPRIGVKLEWRRYTYGGDDGEGA